MSTPYLGQIKVVAFTFAPRRYAFCNGQILSIQQNSALFALIGTTYGGNGTTTFALPNLQGQAPIHFGTLLGAESYSLGQAGGEDSHTLSVAEMPSHTHELLATVAPAAPGGPGSAVLANATTEPYRTAPATTVGMNATAIANAGSSAPHENRQPFLTMNYVIALQGVFPSRN